MSLYALVDCNNFYASCERLFRPDLKNTPIVVLSNNDGCVVARSNEIKKLGIKAGTPFFKVKRELEKINATVFSSNYALYGDLSSRVMNVLSQAVPDMEVYSIDEAFLNIATFPAETNFSQFASDLRLKVELWTGIPVGIGIAPTKTLAKIANHIAKDLEAGVYILTDEQQRIEVLKNLPVSEIWGIGGRTAPKLATNGIFSALDLANASRELLQSRFSINLVRTSLELQGIPAIPIEEEPPPKQSLASSKSFSKLVECPQELKEAAITYTTTVASKLRNNKLLAGTLSVYVQTNKHKSEMMQQHESLAYQLPQPTSSSSVLIPIAAQLIERLYMNGCAYIKCGVVVGALIPEDSVTTDLFSPIKPQSDNLSKALDSINNSLGKDTLFVLGSGLERPWQMKRGYCSPCHSTNWSDLLEVK